MADDIELATEDLRRSWSNEARQRWAIDRVPGDTRAITPTEPAPPAVRLARLRSEAEHLASLIPPNPIHDHLPGYGPPRRPAPTPPGSRRRRHRPVLAGHPGGRGPRRVAQGPLRATAAEAVHRVAPLHRRPGLFPKIRDAAEREAPLEAAYRDLAAQERVKLAPHVAEATRLADDLEAQMLLHGRFVEREHPEIPRRLKWLEREMGHLDAELTDTRLGLRGGHRRRLEGRRAQLGAPLIVYPYRCR